MNDATVTHVLILAAMDAGRRWKAILEDSQTTVWLGRDEIPPGEHPEIILADAGAPLAKARGTVGVIRVGGGQTPADARDADVCLPANCTAEELRRTFRLLSETIHLRLQLSESAETRKMLILEAMTDPLTGLFNRRAWDVELPRRLAEKGEGRQLCLAVIDIDRLKGVNDNQGHAAGDRLLQAISQAMQDNLRQDDFVARLGGDEFGLLFWVPREADAAAVVERVRRRVAKSANELEFAQITASAGFALCEAPFAPDAGKTLYLTADMALLSAKYAGGDRCLPNTTDKT